MITLASLWLPILLSAVFVFIASSIIHMALPWHKSDFRLTPNEDGVMKALRPFAIPPGDYMMPRCERAAEMKTPEYQAKMNQGPVMVYTVLPNGNFAVAKCMALWFVYLIAINAVSAFLAAQTLAVGTHYQRVFAVIGITSLMGLGGALWQNSIWYGKSWLTTFKTTVDAAIYAAITAGTFGWLWPR